MKKNQHKFKLRLKLRKKKKMLFEIFVFKICYMSNFKIRHLTYKYIDWTSVQNQGKKPRDMKQLYKKKMISVNRSCKTNLKQMYFLKK